MTTNQEGRQAAIRDSTSSAYGVAADWHALFDDAGISAGTFNERLLAWINSELSASYSNLVSAMQAYAEDAGYDGWEDMATLVLAMNGAETLLDGETQGLAFDFTDQSALIIDTGTPANNYDSTGIVSSGSLVGPSGKLTYTSPSNKLTLQSDGVMRYQAHNLYLNSAAPANQSITVVSGASYAVTITGTVSVTASGAATGTWTAGTNTFTAATTTLTLGSTSGSGTVHVRRTPSNDDYIATAGAAKYALPLEYSATDGSCLGLLVEEERTNLSLYSTDFTNNTTSGFTTNGMASRVLNVAGPDGLTNMVTVTEDTTTTYHAIFPQAVNRPTPGAVPITVSVLLKAGTRRYVNISAENSGNGFNCTVDTQTWTITQSGATGTGWTFTSASVSLFADGIYRVSMVGTPPAATTVLTFVAGAQNSTDSRVPSYLGDGSTIITGWLQIEAGSFPTSPIVTYGAAATRLADNISIATSAFPYSATAGSVYYQGAFVGVSTASTLRPWTLCDGTTSEVIAGGYVSSAPSFIVNDGGVSQVSISVGSISDGVSYKHASAWEANNFNAAKDGTAGTLDTSGTLPTVTTLYIGSRETGASHANGHIKTISYVPRRKTDAELQAETT